MESVLGVMNGMYLQSCWQYLLVDPVQRIENTVSPKHDHIQACAPQTKERRCERHEKVPAVTLRAGHVFIHPLPIAEDILRDLERTTSLLISKHRVHEQET